MTSTLFEFRGKEAVIENLNLGRPPKKGGGPKTIRLDLRMTVHNLPVKNMAALLCAEADTTSQAFWVVENIDKLKEGDRIDRRFLGLSTFKSGSTYANRHMIVVGDNGDDVRVDKLHKFEVTPTAGELCVVSFTVSVSDPSDKFIAQVTHHFREACIVTLVQDPEIDFDAKKKGTASGKGKGKGKSGKDAAANPPPAVEQPKLALAGEVLPRDNEKGKTKRLSGPARKPPRLLNGPTPEEPKKPTDDDGFTGNKPNP